MIIGLDAGLVKMENAIAEALGTALFRFEEPTRSVIGGFIDGAREKYDAAIRRAQDAEANSRNLLDSCLRKDRKADAMASLLRTARMAAHPDVAYVVIPKADIDAALGEV